MGKITKKDKRRMLIWSMVLFIIVSYLSVFSFNYWSKILANKREKTLLEQKYNDLLKEEATLNDEANKLQNPEYVAKYAREKFSYSKEGEIKIKFSEEEDN